MATASQQILNQVGGLTVGADFSESNDTSNEYEITLPVGQAGTLTTRTDDDTGVATLSSGHGIETGDVVDVYWTSGGTTYVRYGMDATVSGTAVTVDGGAGTVLPAQDTAVVVTIQVEIDWPYDGDMVDAMLLHSSQIAHLDFQESDTTQVAEFLLDTSANTGYYEAWYESSGVSNPLTGNECANIMASNSSSSTAATLKMAFLIDVTP